MNFYQKDPTKAYITNNLALPKEKVNLSPIKTALTFIHGVEEVFDGDTGELLITQAGEIHLWDENRYHIIVPREFIPADHYDQFGFEFVDLRPTKFPEAGLEDHISLKDANQIAAFQALVAHQNGTLNLRCGGGKTVLALKLAAYLNVPTIIVVNTTALLEQWRKEIKKFLGLKTVGIIQGKTANWEFHPVVLAMIQTLAQKREQWPWKFRHRFGLAIYDECFPAGTRVGDHPIEKIKVGDLIPSFDSSQRNFVQRTVTKTFRNKVHALVRVHTSRGTLVCTPNELFLTSLDWVPASSLTDTSIIFHTLFWVRVDYVETLQPGSDGTFGGLCPDGFVYNLEVEDTHTYIANGFVVHNCHHVSAPVFVRSADLFFGRRLSLTATASRIDGLESIYQHHLGGVIHRDLKQELIPLTIFHRLQWVFDLRYKPLVSDFNGDFNMSRIRTYLGSLDWRNEIIYRDLLSDLHDGRKILVLSHSVNHISQLLDIMAQSSRTFRTLTGSITGGTPQEDRMQILDESNPVFGTFQLAREGLDKPTLDTLYITTPFSSPNDLQQAWGRIQRSVAKKEPLVRVYTDTAFGQCIASQRALKRHLKNMDYPYRNKNIQVEATCSI